MKMHPTYNPLPESTRVQLVTILNQLLVDFTSLTYAAKQAHWNVKGVEFIAIHRLFDEVYELASETVDSLAEGITALGGQAYGTIEVVVKETRLPAFPLDLSDRVGLSTELVKRLSNVSAYLIEAIQETGRLDPTTQNNLMNYQDKVNHYIYFIESGLQ